MYFLSQDVLMAPFIQKKQYLLPNQTEYCNFNFTRQQGIDFSFVE